MSAHERINILLVDDDPAKLLSYEVILAELDENLIRARSAVEALEVLLKSDVAVILVDICMPELDGFELAKMLREHPRYEKTAIIFISAILFSDADLVRGYETGAVDYVPVPVIPEILRAKVRIFAELFRKTRQLEKLNVDLEQRVLDRTSELAASTARLQESEARLRLASEAAEFGSYDYHGDTGQVYWSPYLRKLVGIEADERLTIEKALGFIHPDHRDMVRAHMTTHAPGAGRQELEFKLIRADGEVGWFLDRGQTIADPNGTKAKWRVMGTVLDITDRKLAEERQRLLMAELDHRVKNILATVSAIARLSSRNTSSIEQFVKALDGRIQAMSLAHDLLRKVAWGAANLAELVPQALAPFRLRSGDNLRINGEPLWIVSELTQSLALILHELATNALKYGALSAPTGCVTVSWARIKDAPPGQVQITWEESGVPLRSAPQRKGFGMNFLKVAASEIGAVACCEFREGGLVYTLSGPLESQQRPPRAIKIEDRSLPIEPESAMKDKGKMRRILVVEDEVLISMQLQADLEDAGYLVVGPARSVAEGMALVEEEIDAALVDFSLGRETSIPIAERLITRGIPFAIATGYSDSAMLTKRLQSQPYLKKPYTVMDLLRVINRLVVSPDRGDGARPG